MKKCNIIMDLINILPENNLTDESIKEINNHIKECKECKQYYDNVMSEKKNSNKYKIINNVFRTFNKYQVMIKRLLILLAFYIGYSLYLINGSILASIPILVIVPIISGIYYKKYIQICIISFIAFALIVLLGEGTLDLLSYSYTIVGLFIAFIYNQYFISIKKNIKIIAGILMLIILSLSTWYYADNKGTPVGFIDSYLKLKAYINYVNKQDMDAGLYLSGTRFFSDRSSHNNQYYGVLNGNIEGEHYIYLAEDRKSIEFNGYQWDLANLYTNEKENELIGILKTINFNYVYGISATLNTDRLILTNDLNENYYSSTKSITLRDYNEQTSIKYQIDREYQDNYTYYRMNIAGNLTREELIDIAYLIKEKLNDVKFNYAYIEIALINSSSKTPNLYISKNMTKQEIEESYKSNY